MSIRQGIRRQRGTTLIELIVFIVVVSVGLAGVLTVFNVVVKASADPLVTKQALAVADSLLEEVLLKDFCDPTLAIAVTATTTSASNSVTGISPALDYPATDYSSWRVSGIGIAAGTTVASVLSVSSLTLSATAGQSSSGVTLRLAPCVADYASETRATYDDVRDYHNVSTWQNVTDITGTAIFSPPGLYQTKVEVTAPSLTGNAGSGVAAGDVLQVVVSVRAPDGQVYSATGYRYFYD